MLALTDHDEVGGLQEAAAAAQKAGIIFVPGVELSATWAGSTVHVLGLGVDPDCPALAGGIALLATSRQCRAEQMARRFDAIGIKDSLDGASRFASKPTAVGRSHFARFLVERGCARNMGEVFKRYLTPGKPGYVPHQWARLDQAVAWIRAAGGCAVLAHPDRYRLPPTQLHALLDDFKQHGGEAIEISGGLRANPQPQLRLARNFGFALSVGSDFHAQGEGSADLGDTPGIPAGSRTVWRKWQSLPEAV